MFRFASGIPPIGDHFEQEIELLAPCINGESVNPQLLYKRIYGADTDSSTIEITQKTLFVKKAVFLDDFGGICRVTSILKR